MALTAQSIAERAAMIIQDMTNVRWPISEIRNWLNDARRELAIVRPDIYSTTNAAYGLKAGAEQDVPTGCLRLLDIPANAGNGPAITPTPRAHLDKQFPQWTASKYQATVIKHFMLDERDPKKFWVYPPSNGSSSVTVIYQAAPTDFALDTGETAIAGNLNEYESIYGGALVDYIAYRAFSKDSEYAGNAQRAIAHYQQFQNALGQGHKNDLTYSPNFANLHGTPSRQLQAGG